MATYFRPSRNVELSTLEYLETNLATDWSDVTLIKAFKKAYAKNINVPIVCVMLNSIDSVRYELGATTLENRYLVSVDIFAKSDAQRLDLADYILDIVREGWDYKEYQHVSGDNRQIIGTPASKITVTDFITNSKIELGEGDVKDRYRHTITFTVRRGKL